MTCAKKGCTKEAKWHPVLLFYAPKELHCPVPLQSVLSIGICQECQSTAKTTDFLSEDGWLQICASVAALGKVKPKQSLTRLAWLPFGDFDKIRFDATVEIGSAAIKQSGEII